MTSNLSGSEYGDKDHRVSHSTELLGQASSKTAYSLNALLGLGVLGGLLVNVWIFGGFTSNMQIRLLSSPQGFDFRLFSGVSILLVGKMVAIIAIAFGAGMVWFLQKPTEAGKPTRPDLFIQRQVWLIILGVLNGIIFLWSEDILFHLGIMGILVFAFYRLSSRALIIASFVTAVLFAGKYYWNYSDDKGAYNKYLAVMNVEKKIKQDSISKAATKKNTTATAQAIVKKDTLTKEQKKDKATWEGLIASVKYDAKKDEGSMKAMRKHEYKKIYDHLLPATQMREAHWTYHFGIWDLASMIFLGMSLFGYGFFSGRLSSSKYFLICICFVVAGLLLGWYRFYFQIEAIRDYQKFVVRHSLPYNIFFPFEQGFLALGYAAGIMSLISAGFLKRPLRVLSSVGKMALTNYLLQSIACTLFFTGFGLGYFGRLDQHQLYIIVFEIWIVQIVFSVLWLRRFKEGPAEWLWRCLTYQKRLPIKRSGKSNALISSPIAS